MFNKFLFLIVVLSFSLLSGCASTGGSSRLVSGTHTDKLQTSKFSELLITVQPTNNVHLTEEDTERIAKLIAKDVKSDDENKFKTFNPASPSSTTLQASVAIKNYDEGSAFARAMLAGLGQIHIDADVSLFNFSTKEKLAQYEVTKTFAWGGMYGGFTNIKDVEEGFCKAVADSILGKE